MRSPPTTLWVNPPAQETFEVAAVCPLCFSAREPEGKRKAGLPMVFIEPVQELGPVCAAPLTGGVVCSARTRPDPD